MTSVFVALFCIQCHVSVVLQSGCTHVLPIKHTRTRYFDNQPAPSNNSSSSPVFYRQDEGRELTNWNTWNRSEKRSSIEDPRLHGAASNLGQPRSSIWDLRLVSPHPVTSYLSQASRSPHHWLCTVGRPGVRISQRFHSGPLHPSQGQNSRYRSKRSRRSISPFLLPCIHDMARMPINADGDDQASIGFHSAVFMLFSVKLSVSFTHCRLRAPHLFTSYYG
ncbi:hypothetical protein QR685DRAFT_213394 [Neurospora intermedia]|uniref:Secreted protein n=1 Tax=Neurospora intermedia TaxID=5142 RepID=A0ABR3DGD5_NEUIN